MARSGPHRSPAFPLQPGHTTVHPVNCGVAFNRKRRDRWCPRGSRFLVLQIGPSEDLHWVSTLVREQGGPVAHCFGVISPPISIMGSQFRSKKYLGPLVGPTGFCQASKNCNDWGVMVGNKQKALEDQQWPKSWLETFGN